MNWSKEIGLYIERSGETHEEPKQRSQVMVQNRGYHRVKAVVLLQVKINNLNQCCCIGN